MKIFGGTHGVVGLDVEVAELPDDGVHVPAERESVCDTHLISEGYCNSLLLIVVLGLIEELLPLELVQLTATLQLLHHLERRLVTVALGRRESVGE